MATMRTLIDKISSLLNDSNNEVFSRTEILKWLSEAYRHLTREGDHAKTFTVLDLPPRHTRTITFPWEADEGTGTYRKWTYSYGESEFTFLWEMERAAGITTPSADGGRAVSYLWELYSGDEDVDTHYRLMLPKNHNEIIHVWHDDEIIRPTTELILDSHESRWWKWAGEPLAWVRTLGEENTFEVFEIETSYYESASYPDGDQGAPRGWEESDETYTIDNERVEWDYAYAWNGEPQAAAAGALSGMGVQFMYGPTEDGYYYTYPWEADSSVTEDADPVYTYWWEAERDIETGIVRHATSTTEQYWPHGQWDVYGVIRRLNHSENNIMVYHGVYADNELTEDSDTQIIPSQIQKYLIYYVLSILFNRQGEIYNPNLAQHYGIRWPRGVEILKRLGRISRIDEQYTRGRNQAHRKPPLPTLPSNYPRAPWLR